MHLTLKETNFSNSKYLKILSKKSFVLPQTEFKPPLLISVTLILGVEMEKTLRLKSIIHLKCF